MDTQAHSTGAAAAPSREAAAPLDEAALAEFLGARYTAAPSTPRRLGWMLELLREMHLDSAAALTSVLPATPDARILALVEGRATVDTVRMLDDELLLVAPEAFIKANRAVPDERNPQTDPDPGAPATDGWRGAEPAGTHPPGRNQLWRIVPVDHPALTNGDWRTYRSCSTTSARNTARSARRIELERPGVCAS